MNISVVSGKLVTEPRVMFIEEDGLSTVVCKGVLAAATHVSHGADRNKVSDCFEIIAFAEEAKLLADQFIKGSGITVYGSLRNFLFEDCNGTRHFTNVILVHMIESEGRWPIFPNMERDQQVFDSMCKMGYLAIDEDNYYDLARNWLGQAEGEGKSCLR